MAKTCNSDYIIQDSVANYMDGIQVKIAEAYKPPRKIALPAFYNNKLPDVTKYDYDFQFEIAILEKMSEWRKIRQNNVKCREELKEEKCNDDSESTSVTSDTDNHVATKVTIPLETTILTPQPLSPLVNQIQDIKINGLDYSDFDNDTSSPFDNMELKTINDMEELAQVLQPTSQWTGSVVAENLPNETTEIAPVENQEDEVEKQKKANEQISPDKETNTKDNKENNRRMVSSILKDLEKLLERPCIEKSVSWPHIVTSEADREPMNNSVSETKSPDPLSDLSDENRNLAKHLNDMGFSLSRAARAIQYLGGQDNKKIVEYLLSLQYLEDAGFEERIAMKALVLTNNDEHRAKIYCENLVILKNFGFDEDRASDALVECDLDRDKALDLLIT